jgi:phosphoribosylanthranilate isomerase
MTLTSEWLMPLDGPRIKICGLTRKEDGIAALEAGASFLGVVFAESPRRVTPERAKELMQAWRAHNPKVHVIGVFVSTPVGEVGKLVEQLGLYAAQLHGHYSTEALRSADFRILRALPIVGAQDNDRIAEAQEIGPVLLDAYAAGKHGGTGRMFDHSVAVPAIRRGLVFIAGGLNPTNVYDVMDRFASQEAMPYALDVSSGVEEALGVKSRGKIIAFMESVHRGMSSKPEIKLP